MADIDYDTNTQYDVIVIGGGAAGLVSSSFLAALDLEVALVSDGHPGGECLWTGCVPSKALIHAASLAKRGVSGDDSFYEAMNFMKKAIMIALRPLSKEMA